MNPRTKIVSLYPAGVVLTLAGLIASSLVLSFFGLVFMLALAVAIWAIWSSGGCDGHVKWRSTESGEVFIGVCNRCARWQINVRGSGVARGEGLKKFLVAAEEVALRYDRVVPQISGELRAVAAQLDGGEDASPAEGFQTERES